jgi:hypothetical protein
MGDLRGAHKPHFDLYEFRHRLLLSHCLGFLPAPFLGLIDQRPYDQRLVAVGDPQDAQRVEAEVNTCERRLRYGAIVSGLF